MEIIKQGKLQEDREHDGTCPYCGCMVRFKEKEAELRSLPKNEEVLVVKCPTDGCPREIWVWKITITEPPRKEFDVDDDTELIVEHVKPLCTLAQAKSYAPMVGMTDAEAEVWWHARNANGWMKGTQGGGPVKIGSFQSDMKQSVSWVREQISKNGINGKKVWKPNL